MTEAERQAATTVWMHAHRAEWGAYLALPWQERAAMRDKVQQATEKGGARGTPAA